MYYKKGRTISGRNFIVEISGNHKVFYIAAYDIERPQNFIISLPKKKSKRILDVFGNDFEKVVHNLTIVKNRLVLLNGG